MNFINTFKKIYKLENDYTDNTYTYLNFGGNAPKQGWKLHISAIPQNYLFILNNCINYCLHNNIDMKFIKEYSLFLEYNSKGMNRASSGKFITIYPKDEQAFIKVCQELYLFLKECNGPYVLSDKRYKDCKVMYYRYGRCLVDNLESDEEKVLLTDPNGNKVPDRRQPYYIQPTFVKPPFPDEDEFSNSESKLLGDRYKIIKAIHFSNSGGTYQAIDTKNDTVVIIKEARPYTENSSYGDSIVYRKKEKLLFEIFTEYCPKVLDSFFEWEHYFVVVEYINGETLLEFSDKVVEDLYLRKNLNGYLEKVNSIIINLLKIITTFHNMDIAINDISNTNIMIKDSKLYIIDLEGGTFSFEEKKFITKTPGFVIDNLNINEYAQDYISLGLLIISLFSGTHSIANLDRNTAVKLFYNFSTKFSLNSVYYELIYGLLMNPEYIDINYYIYILSSSITELANYEFLRLKNNIEDDSYNFFEINNSGKLELDISKISFNNEHFFLAYFLNLTVDNIKFKNISKIKDASFFEKYLSDQMIDTHYLAKLTIYFINFLKKDEIYLNKSQLSKGIKKLVDSQNNNGSFISQDNHISGQGIVEGETIIILALIEYFNYFKDENVFNALERWICYADKFDDTKYPIIDKNKKSPYLANGYSGILLSKWYLTKFDEFKILLDKKEVDFEIENLPLVSSNVSIGYGVSGIAFLKILTNNISSQEILDLTNLLLNFQTSNQKYPSFDNSHISQNFFKGEAGIMFLWMLIYLKELG